MDCNSNQCSNLFQVNDWPIRRFLLVFIIFQITIISFILLFILGIFIPIVEPIIFFLYLSFFPGILILKIFRLHKLGNSYTLLYAIGVSIILLMIFGFFLNTFFPLVGIKAPLSFLPLSITISILNIILCISAYLIDKGYADPINFDLEKSISPSTLFLLLLPFLAIIGTFIENTSSNNFLLLFLIFIIAFIFLSVGFDRIFSPIQYSLILVIVSLTLLLHTSLISPYMTGADIHIEYYFANLVIKEGFWNTAIESNVNAMLSVTMLNPIYSILLNIEPDWVFKIIYPIIFSFTPLALYECYQKMFDKKIAFFAVVFFIGGSIFFTTMISLPRQQIAEFFLALLILLIINKDINLFSGRFLAIIFGLGIIMSHYSLAFIISIIFCSVLILNALYKIFFLIRWQSNDSFIGLSFIILFILLNLAWNTYLPSSLVFQQAGYGIKGVYQNLDDSFFQVQESQPANALLGSVFSPMHNISKFLAILALFLILIGIIVIIYYLIKKEKMPDFELDGGFSFISISMFTLLCAGFIIPNLFLINFSRMYHISLMVLAPFSLIGCIYIFKILRYNHLFRKINNDRISVKFLAIFFTLMFLFTSGFIFELMNDYPNSIAISKKSISESNDLIRINSFYSSFFMDQDISGIKWITSYRNPRKIIYSDLSHFTLPMVSYGMILNSDIDPPILKPDTFLDRESYLFLGYSNTNYGILNGPYLFRDYFRLSEISNHLQYKNLVYSNSGSKIFL